MTVRFVPRHVRSAIEAVSTERQRTAAERDAFDRFADRVDAVDISTDCSTPRPDRPATTQVALRTESQSKSPLTDTRIAFRETVMDVSHYEEEYDESLKEHLSVEFSPEIATALTTGEQFIPALQEQLVTASRDASATRDTFLSALENETSSLRTADKQLTELGNEGIDDDLLTSRSLEAWSRPELIDIHQQIQTCTRRCEDLARERQSTLHKQRVPSVRHIDLDFVEYLYQSLSVTYPVLADIVSFEQTLDTTGSRIERALDSER